MGISLLIAITRAPPPDTDVNGALLTVAQRYANHGLTAFREITTAPVSTKRAAQQQQRQRRDYVTVVT